MLYSIRMNAKQFTCLNGSFVLSHRAAISAADRGWRFGDGVFETIRIENGAPYQWALHMARLANGLAALRIPSPTKDWAPFAKKLVSKNKVDRGFLRLSVSRGTGSAGYLPHPPTMPATWIMEILPKVPELGKPYQLWVSAIAKIPAQCLPIQQKLAQGVNSILALLETKDNGCDEALQLTIDGFIAEAASANIFWVKDNTLYTPSLDVGCLNGTTRDAVIRLSSAPTRLVREGLSVLEDAEAVFLTNTRLGVWPIAALQPAGWQFHTAHPLIQQLQQALRADYKNAGWDHA